MNNSIGPNTSQIYEDEAFAAYDRLPKELRVALQNSWFDFNELQIEQCYKEKGLEETIALIRINDRLLARSSTG